tara:strand:- start:45 stop:497 length:453 start_codon:yes stop_codon:yes gene_type:complete
MPYKNKEYCAEKKKLWAKSPTGIKSCKISSWKRQGIDCENWDIIYEWFLTITNCERCYILLTIDKKTTRTTKCLDHDHSTGKIRKVLCHSCNVNDRKTNTTKIPNIYYCKNANLWLYSKTINKIRNYKSFLTKEEAINYKKEYEKDLYLF